MIGRICGVVTGDKLLIGRVVSVALSPRFGMSDRCMDLLPERWIVLVEDDRGRLHSYTHDQITSLFPEGADRPLGWHMRSKRGDS